MSRVNTTVKKVFTKVKIRLRRRAANLQTCKQANLQTGKPVALGQGGVVCRRDS